MCRKAIHLHRRTYKCFWWDRYDTVVCYPYFNMLYLYTSHQVQHIFESQKAYPFPRLKSYYMFWYTHVIEKDGPSTFSLRLHSFPPKSIGAGRKLGASFRSCLCFCPSWVTLLLSKALIISAFVLLVLLAYNIFVISQRKLFRKC